MALWRSDAALLTVQWPFASLMWPFDGILRFLTNPRRTRDGPMRAFDGPIRHLDNLMLPFVGPIRPYELTGTRDHAGIVPEIEALL
jgi:hypothetical protein